LSVQTTNISLIGSNAATRVYVPSNNNLGLTWTSQTYVDSAWYLSNTPVAFAVGTVATPMVAIDVNERGVDPTANTQPGFSSFVINSNISSGTIQTQATTRVFGGITVTVSNASPNGYDDRLRGTPVNGGAL